MTVLQDLASRALHVLDPEDAHHAAIKALKAGLGPRDSGLDDPCLAVELKGLQDAHARPSSRGTPSGPRDASATPRARAGSRGA